MNFGTGSNKFSSAEDSIFIKDIKDSGLKIYEYLIKIGKIDHRSENSSWFTGFDEKYFYDRGAFIKAAYPKLYYILKWYYVFKNTENCKLGKFEILKYLNKGIKGYDENISYEFYKERNKQQI